MTTSTSPVSSPRVPLRLRMVDDPVPGGLHRRSWPQSRDLGVERADLVDHFPSVRGGVMRAAYTPLDWDTALRRVRVKRADMKAGSFPRDDTHVRLLTTFDRSTLTILVVPPGASPHLGEAPLRTGSPEDVAAAAQPAGADATDRWADDVGAVGAGTGAPGRPGVGG